ncbi:unnamed protein product [Mycena citricolor]|uniref:C2H2-type domain-containing protein n=1 Tax=Mycena citricolor TaxID=2018698 RepID=A0AAD2K7J9_9AGAR|nr:unnamed protein product [Mycena citricolor]
MARSSKATAPSLISKVSKKHPACHSPPFAHACPEPGCGKSWARAYDLKRHLLTHLPREEKESVMLHCLVKDCEFRTLQQGNLNIHMNVVHTRKRPHHCPVVGCEFSTSDPAIINRHQKKHIARGELKEAHAPVARPKKVSAAATVRYSDDDASSTASSSAAPSPTLSFLNAVSSPSGSGSGSRRSSLSLSLSPYSAYPPSSLIPSLGLSVLDVDPSHVRVPWDSPAYGRPERECSPASVAFTSPRTHPPVLGRECPRPLGARSAPAPDAAAGFRFQRLCAV